MPRAWMKWGILGVCLALLGCQGSTSAPKPDQSSETTPADGQPAESPEGTAPAAKPQFTMLDGVDSFEGTWVLAPVIQRAGRHLWLLRLSPGEDGKWTIQSLYNEPMMGQITGVDVTVTGDQLVLNAKIDNPKAQVKTAKLSFEGTLRDGQVWGNAVIGEPTPPIPARLIPTDAETLADYADSRPEVGQAPFDEATRQPDPAHGLWKAAKANPASPVALEVYGSLFSQIEKWNFTEEEARAAATDFAKATEHWGARLQGQMEVDAGLSLAKVRKFIDLAEEFLNAGEGRAPKDSPLVEMKLKAGRINVRIARGLVAIHGEDAAAAAAAAVDLKTLLENQAYHPELMLALAEHTRKTEQTDEAIDYYLKLVGLPMMEEMALSSRLGKPADDQLPHNVLPKLWEAKHGTLEALPAALAETYQRETSAILAKIREAAPALPEAEAGNRTLLVEFFTGTACQPCVATDLALTGLFDGVPATKAILLSYHQHLPAPDPLTSMDGEARSKFYNLQGTPSVVMNGAPIERSGGYFLPEHIEQNYYLLREPIAFFSKMSTEVKIEPTAEVVDGQFHVKVAVSGVPDDVISKVRLRMAIAEENVEFVGPNGIRQHHMVVRTLLGGTGGKSANKDKVLEYSISMPVAELKARQMAYLIQFEHGRRIEFPVKPVDLKPLHLVAFVQNDATREVLQAAATPVQGEIVYPEMKFPSPDDPAVSPTDSNQPTDKPSTDDAPEKAAPPDKTSEETPPEK